MTIYFQIIITIGLYMKYTNYLKREQYNIIRKANSDMTLDLSGYIQSGW